MPSCKTRPAEPPYTRGAHVEAIQHVERQLARLRGDRQGADAFQAVLDATPADVAIAARERGKRALGRVTR